MLRRYPQGMTPQGTQVEGTPSGHEHGDANIRGVVVAMTIILSSTAVILLTVGVMYRVFDSSDRAIKNKVPSPLFTQPPKPGPNVAPLLPSPAEEIMPWDVGNIERAKQEAQANSYARNPETGAATIPVAVAMEEMGNKAPASKKGGAAQKFSSKGTPSVMALEPNTPLYPPSSQFEDSDEKMNVDSSGGHSLEETKR